MFVFLLLGAGAIGQYTFLAGIVTLTADLAEAAKPKKGKYGHLSPKEAEAIPCQKLFIDLHTPSERARMQSRCTA
jgi:hypothetical protein